MPQQDQPEQTYIPQCKVRLIVRFDDFGKHKPARPTPQQLRRGTKWSGALPVAKQGNAWVIGSTARGGPQAKQTSADGYTQVVEGIVPARCTVSRNGIRTADTASIEFRFADFPVDPRVVRSCAVEVYMGCMNDADFTAGLRGQAGASSPATDNASRPLNVIPDSYLDSNGKQRTNLRLSGWVDEWEVEFPDGEDEPTVRLECTDNTRLIIEQDAPPQLYLDGTLPLDQAVATYLANFPQCDGLSVLYLPVGDTPPKVGQSLSKLAMAQTQAATAAAQTVGGPTGTGPSPAGGAAGGAAPEKVSSYDYLTDVCGMVAHTLRVQDEVVIVQRARTIYGAKFPGRQDDPFQGRTLPSGRFLQARTFVYGRNCDALSFKRKLTRFAPQNVEVRCYSGKQKKTVVARFPQMTDRNARVLPGGDGTADDKWVVHEVHGVEDPKVLAEIAQGIYESVGRNELEANFATINLGSYGGSASDPDALDCVAGDTVEVEVARDGDGFNSVCGVEEDVATKAESFMRSLGFSAEFSAAYGKAAANINYPTLFRVRELTLDWDAGDGGGDSGGIKLTFACVNYLEVVSDKELPAGQEPGNPAPAQAPAPVVIGSGS